LSISGTPRFKLSGFINYRRALVLRPRDQREINTPATDIIELKLTEKLARAQIRLGRFERRVMPLRFFALEFTEKLALKLTEKLAL
jgi:hypothetical protein